MEYYMKGLYGIVLIVMLASCIVGVYGEEERGVSYGDYELFSNTDVVLTHQPGYVMIIPSDRNEVVYIFTHMFDNQDQAMQAFSYLTERQADTAQLQKGYAHIHPAGGHEEDLLLLWTPESGYMYTLFS
jgi:hypothetical protein